MSYKQIKRNVSYLNEIMMDLIEGQNDSDELEELYEEFDFCLSNIEYSWKSIKSFHESLK